MIFIFLEFVLVASIVVVASKHLACKAEMIEENSTFNPIFMGLVLSAATSLPELVSALTSISLGNDVTAVSNVLGSNVFNIFALALINIILIKKRIFRRVAPDTFKTAKIAIVMYGLVTISFIITHYFNINLSFFTMSFTITSLLIAMIYCYSLFKSGSDSDEVVNQHQHVNLTRTYEVFLVLVIVNVLASMILAHTAEDIVLMTGMSESVVGAVLVGIATSLPEIITCYALIQKNKNVMAVTSILGSNTFNFLTFTLLDFTTPHSIYDNLDINTFLYMLLGLVLSVIMYFIGHVRGRFYLVPSLIIIILYFTTVVLSAII